MTARPLKTVRWWLAIGGAAAASSLVLPLPSATAAAEDHACVGNAETTYEGGLNKVKKPVVVDGKGSLTCMEKGGEMSSGSITFSNRAAPGQLSCSGGNTSFTGQIDWADGTKSTFEAGKTETHKQSGVTALVFRGQVTGGEHQGKSLEGGFALSKDEDEQACGTKKGLTGSSGPFTLIFR
ncbi:hypothetical protein GCM10012275_31290 [Longimycelium tulufanense]|uniref:Uncharacterized protein n=1 Tax=Longimycelium tulufanense TaxID=907463 RepID=A0A8J3CGK8_9PSEU|nr:hypothetical protein [Longimycelium tulufanense]GGM57833.1 hypothetical protein GCM10012275_31290 [Longimycelium tulufanense]